MLRIPVMHDGGLSLREQIILADKHEAVMPMAELNRMMERAMMYTYDRVARGGAVSTSSTTYNNTISAPVHLHYQGDGHSRNDIYRSGQMFIDELDKCTRPLGLPITGRRG